MILNFRNIVTVCLTFALLSSFARQPEFDKSGNTNGGNRVKAKSGGCAPASAVALLAFNNVSARIENGGGMWLDRGVGNAGYAAPKGANPQTFAIYAGSLWMGGKAPGNVLKLAAVTFRQSGQNDFWPGPLTVDGGAEIDADECTEWDRFFVTSKAQVAEHKAYFAASPDEQAALDYDIPKTIKEWPAHGGINQDDNIAPFYDVANDGEYDWSTGDYPLYDLVGELECRSNARFVPLFGDTTIYWVFNDKGAEHTQSKAEPIGMEIRAQAFAFSSEDEVNNMTFYNYVLINQGSQELTDTYFGQWVDADLGNAFDDYVGCDVQRGLGFCYNGDNVDEDGTGGQVGFGETPPAIGIDFFEGPFQDDDYIDAVTGQLYTGDQLNTADKAFDNPLTDNAQDAYDSLGIPYKGLGIGYGDGIPNNERFGMRKFVYYRSDGTVNGEPQDNSGADFYSYLTGNWLSGGGPMVYGGDGVGTGGGSGDPSQPADFMFPGTTDVLGFGTGGNVQDDWSEVTAGNAPSDRRFMQSAGPFTLKSGAVNNITVGVVYARAKSGGAEASIVSLKIADDKAQQLFDNCFQILEGPDAPELTIKEYDKELIVYITNPSTSNNNINYNEDYKKVDPRAIVLDTNGNNILTPDEQSYVFQGYVVYQLKDQNVSIADVGDAQLARLIYQCDIKDTITRLINYVFDPELKLPIPKIMVEGTNQGIKHSFKVTTDQFAQGNNFLVNHKTYYFVAIAYGSNKYQPYNPVDLTGQAVQYISSRKNGRGGSISAVSAIPHKLKPNTKVNVSYGEGIPITRVEGIGNGFNSLKISDKTREKMFNSKVLDPGTNRYVSIGLDTIEYELNGGPVSVEIIDPLKVQPGDYEINVIDNNFTNADRLHELDDAVFELIRYDANGNEEYRDTSGTPLIVGSELYFEKFGFAITMLQYNSGDPVYSGDVPRDGFGYASYALPAEMLESEIVYEDESNKWLVPINDGEGLSPQNWILSGTFNAGDDAGTANFRDILGADPLNQYESIIGGGWAPFSMVAATASGPVQSPPDVGSQNNDAYLRFHEDAYAAKNPNVDIIFTPDTSKWTRSVVLEMRNDGANGAVKGRPRQAASVDKKGGTGTAEANFISATGMGWFPGYAVDVETGDRLNIAFGEDSRYTSENGADMLYNPGTRLMSNIGNTYYGAGKHFIFVFKNDKRYKGSGSPAYDNGLYSYNLLKNASNFARRLIWPSCAWVGNMKRNIDVHYEPNGQEVVDRTYELLSSEIRVSLRIARPYQMSPSKQYTMADVNSSLNGWRPKYLFNIPESYKFEEISVDNASEDDKNEILDIIGIVPNPYYSYASYETGKLDTRVKFTNLPARATIKIFTTNGTLVKTIEKDSELSYVDWNLKNEVSIPISSGTYIVHINVPGVGEKVMKWFGVMRKPALQNL